MSLSSSALPDSGTIVLNAANVTTNSSNNSTQLTVTFPGGVDFRDREIALGTMSLYYSWYSISSAYGNNTFSYYYPTTVAAAQAYVQRSITIPDGTYSVTDLNNYLHYTMVQNGDYLLDASGNYVYYAQFSVNATRYAVQLDAFPVPTALPAGYTNGGTALPTSTDCPHIVVPSGGFGTIIGFAAGSFPAAPTGGYAAPTGGYTSSNYTTYSTSIPQVTPVSAVKLVCDILSRDALESFPGVLYQFSNQGVSSGEIITVEPKQYIWKRAMDNTIQSLKLTFVDQNNNPLLVNDPQINIILLHRSTHAIH